MSITFTEGGDSATVDNPEYGYQCEIAMAMTYSKRDNKRYGIFDHGFNYDVRMCRGVTFNCTAADMDSLSDLFRDSDKGRGSNVTLSLGTTSGFFPFGPDFGDSGDFVVRVVNYDPGGQVTRPWKQYRPKMDILYVSGPSPSYSYSDTLDDGGVQLGSVTGLKWPQTGYKTRPEYAVNNVVTRDGTAHEIDDGAYSDNYINAGGWTGNQGKFATLVNHLTVAVRDSNLSLVTPADHYAFGRDQAASGEMLVQPLYSEIRPNNAVLSVVHDRFDHFTMPISLRFVS